MQKIGDSTTTANESGEWTEGDPAAGRAATLIKADWLNTIQRELVAVVTGAGISLNKDDDTQLLKAIGKLAGAAADFTKLLNKPTTLGGYGITDVYTATYMDGLLAQKSDASHSHTFESLTGKPTTLGGYGITDVYTSAYMDGLLAQKAASNHQHTFASLTGKPTTLGGYGITDVYTATYMDGLLAQKSDSTHSHTFASLSAKPTTLGGYGITDVYSKTEVNTYLSQRVGADGITGAGFVNGNKAAPYFRTADTNEIINLAAASETYSMSSFMKPVGSQWVLLQGSPPVLPAGGTWAYFKTDFNLNGTPYGGSAGVAAGGTTLTTSSYSVGFAWRIQ